MELSRYFKITGMALTNTHIIAACTNRQLIKIRFQPEKIDEMGRISLLA